MKAYIHTIDYALAKNKITNDQLATIYPDYPADVIFKNSGVKNRYAVDKGTICTDFAAKNTLHLLKKNKINKEDFDFLIYCTEAPDYIAPASSTILHHKLGLRKDCGTFDLNFGCSGYTYGLLLAKSLIESGAANTILFVTADIPTQVISAKDKALRFLFSDAVSLTTISNKKSELEVGKFVKGTDGSGEMALRVENSGFNTPRDADWYELDGNKELPVGRMAMDGTAVFRFSLETVPGVIKEVLEKNSLKEEEVDLYIFHQASQIILKSLQRKLKIEDKRIFNNLADVGNTVSASIPIALYEAKKKGIVQKNMNILIIGFGIGFSWSATIVKTKDV